MPDRQQIADRATDRAALPSAVDSVTTPPAGRRRRGRRIALIILLVVVLLGAGAVGAGAFYLRSVESGIERVDAFTEVPEQARPQVVAKDALNIMILGSDSRDPENSSGSRSDTIILAHLPKDRASAQLISIPRDTWVHVPRSKNGQHGGRDAKINAAFAWGGVPLMVQTVESFTGVRIDHVAMVDFAGFKEIVDALGGIEIDVETSFTSTHSLNSDSKRTFVQGRQKVDGAAALDYARERYAFADGDFARIRHQQQVIKAILDKAASGGTLSNPAKLNAFLQATTNAVSVDQSLSILDFATELRHLRSGNLSFFTCPTKGTGRVGSESVVFADKPGAEKLFDAVRRDSTSDIASAGT
ncbi:transcriptional regulator [Micromonospora globispora]|uniref:Transcriptional regulator n=1 Tax=Micromonospora globispora TaxID=1450148 RepID=A0A317JY28_9ACTN|nr:LCP family protein [Micromonospora globispora]PWU43993.1 transcriptional regulator [Micromonospora globispora]PWU52092.1 transcriptional regulator [Micromonospora globispora]RQW86429.1 transcriptional regulator [Micromonospora globispora]